MSFREVFEIVRLRWYLAAAVLLVTAAAGWKVDHPQRVYQATAVLLLVPPLEPTAPNSLAAATPSIAVTGLMVDTMLTDPSAADRLRQAGVVGEFSVTPRNNGTTETPKYSVPAEQLTMTGTDPDALLASVTALSRQFKLQLADLQARADVVPSLRITTQPLVEPTVSPVKGSKIRGLFGVAVLGVLGAVLAPHWFERIARRRKRRAAAPRPERIAAA